MKYILVAFCSILFFQGCATLPDPIEVQKRNTALDFVKKAEFAILTENFKKASTYLKSAKEIYWTQKSELLYIYSNFQRNQFSIDDSYRILKLNVDSKYVYTLSRFLLSLWYAHDDQLQKSFNNLSEAINHDAKYILVSQRYKMKFFQNILKSPIKNELNELLLSNATSMNLNEAIKKAAYEMMMSEQNNILITYGESNALDKVLSLPIIQEIMNKKYKIIRVPVKNYSKNIPLLVSRKVFHLPTVEVVSKEGKLIKRKIFYSAEEISQKAIEAFLY